MLLLRAITRLFRPDVPQGLVGHLEALRRTLLAMMAVLATAFVFCFCFVPQITDFLRRPVEQVQQRYETEHLPAGLAVTDWQAAKRWAALRPALSPAARRAAETTLPAAVRRLAEAVPPLQAVQLLPPGQRRAALAASAEDAPTQALLLDLYEAGAVLTPAADTQLMGVFRPAESFLLAVNLAFIAALVLSFPALLFLLLRFILPGLHPQERRVLKQALLWGSLLFLGGCAFAYAAVLPRVLGFFLRYAQELGIENDWRIGYYLSFAAKLILLFGAVFELPVLLLPLIRLGILRYELMRRTRAYAFLGCLGLALLLAPAPDPGTMLLLALPLYALYELSILFASRMKTKRPA
ncbi:MAG: twin-arginine translocase subunit TatC [Akkermansia sp.]|nr:twin-arginine translocase subunit TatC [Akkermansia sp.]